MEPVPMAMPLAAAEYAGPSGKSPATKLLPPMAMEFAAPAVLPSPTAVE
jgi:hypothetical protein